MSYAVTAAKSGDDEKISAGLAKIRECDPTVRLRRDEVTHEFLLSGMGDQHLAIVAKRLKDQFKVEAVLDTPRVPYRETITAPAKATTATRSRPAAPGSLRRSFSASRRTKPAMNSPTT